MGASPPGTSWKSTKAIKVLSDVINTEPTKIWTTSELLARRWQVLHLIKNFVSPQTFCSCKRCFWMKCHSLNDKAESKRSISEGFINGFSVQTLYLLSHTVLSLRRIPCTAFLPSCGCWWWDLCWSPSSSCAGLRRALQPGWLHKPSQARGTSPRCVFSLKHLFTIFMPTQKMASSSAAAVIFSL